MLLTVVLAMCSGGAFAPVDPADGVCASPQPGLLTLDTVPWTVVYLDGVYVGSTPLFRAPLPPGPHALTLVNEEAGVIHHEEIVAEEGQARRWKLVLQAEHQATLLDASRTHAPDGACEVHADGAALLTISSAPWARVWLDGRRIGTTPLFRRTLAPGPHEVRLIGEDGRSANARFDAAPGETVKLALRLVPDDELVPTSAAPASAVSP